MVNKNQECLKEGSIIKRGVKEVNHRYGEGLKEGPLRVSAVRDVFVEEEGCTQQSCRRDRKR